MRWQRSLKYKSEYKSVATCENKSGEVCEKTIKRNQFVSISWKTWEFLHFLKCMCDCMIIKVEFLIPTE